MTTESKAIGHDGIDACFAGDVRDVVEVAAFARILQVDRRRQDARLDRECGQRVSPDVCFGADSVFTSRRSLRTEARAKATCKGHYEARRLAVRDRDNGKSSRWRRAGGLDRAKQFHV